MSGSSFSVLVKICFLVSCRITVKIPATITTAITIQTYVLIAIGLGALSVHAVPFNQEYATVILPRQTNPNPPEVLQKEAECKALDQVYSIAQDTCVDPPGKGSQVPPAN